MQCIFFLSSSFLSLLLFRIHQMKEELGILSVKDDEIKQLKSRYRKIKMINNRECSWLGKCYLILSHPNLSTT